MALSQIDHALHYLLYIIRSLFLVVNHGVLKIYIDITELLIIMGYSISGSLNVALWRII